MQKYVEKNSNQQIFSSLQFCGRKFPFISLQKCDPISCGAFYILSRGALYVLKIENTCILSLMPTETSFNPDLFLWPRSSQKWRERNKTIGVGIKQT
jgi:hypothetical protein